MMERSNLELILSFPGTKEIIFGSLDNKSLGNVAISSRFLRDIVRSYKYYWIRIIKNYATSGDMFGKSWEVQFKLLSKSNLQILAEQMMQFAKMENFSDDQSPVYVAAASQNFECFDIVLENYLINETDDGELMLTFFHAALNGDVRNCDILSSIVQNFQYWVHGLSPLHAATYIGNLQICKIIMDEIEYFPPDMHGRDPLHLAANNINNRPAALQVTFHENTNNVKKTLSF